ncbi:MAG: thiamine pyrophosphate-dependent dehydrogenase E1 component subunit alpha [Chthoniobacter sp.]|uniref:thiamine pyrophosphate-dependent dehydrogenase E1 component subunit alpha n=1 Tax=Chthoniobacter sp. TaxID=2510640 RepID=UPI0032AA8E88
MVQATAVSTASADTSDLKARFLAGYRWMLLARVTEEKIAALYRGGKITGGVFLGKGQEALSTATGMALRKGDIFAPLIRDQAGRLAFGESLLDCTRTYMGSRLGPMRGRDGNVHRGRPREGILAMISHLGAMLPVVAGSLLARRFQGIEGTVGAVSLGDGATSTGAFHEGINMAAVEKLPLVLVIANNQYAYSTPTSRQFACEDLVDKAVGYGIAGHSVDGTDLEACLTVLQRAVAAARAGGGPQFVVASLLRLVGHGEHDDASYVDPKLRKTPLGADCLEVAEKRLLKEQWADVTSLRALHEELQREVEDAVAITMREPLPDPNTEDWCPLASRHLSDGNQ